jgi:hypothetical protein
LVRIWNLAGASALSLVLQSGASFDDTPRLAEILIRAGANVNEVLSEYKVGLKSGLSALPILPFLAFIRLIRF